MNSVRRSPEVIAAQREAARERRELARQRDNARRSVGSLTGFAASQCGCVVIAGQVTRSLPRHMVDGDKKRLMVSEGGYAWLEEPK